jgi:hypothetical protein
MRQVAALGDQTDANEFLDVVSLDVVGPFASEGPT